MNRFLFGLGLGITAGLLFAPARGEDTRRELRERFDESVETGKRKFDEVLEEGRARVGEIAETLRPEQRRA